MVAAIVIVSLLLALGLSQGHAVSPAASSEAPGTSCDSMSIRPVAAFSGVRQLDMQMTAAGVEIIPIRWVVTMLGALVRCPLLVLVVEGPGVAVPAVLVIPRRARPSAEPGWSSRPLSPAEIHLLDTALRLDRSGRTRLALFQLRPTDRSAIRGEVAQVDTRGAVALVQAGLLSPAMQPDVDRAWPTLRERLLAAAGVAGAG